MGDEKKPDHIPAISAVMTPFPWVASRGDSLASAKSLMKKHSIRHLPVTERGKVVGVLTSRDIFVAEASRSAGATSPKKATVADIAIQDAYVVDTHERLDRVLVEMAARHIDSALVVKDGKVAGIFTVTDACQHFAAFLRRMFPDQGNDDVA